MDLRKVFPDIPSLAQSAAEYFVDLASKAIQARGNFSVALSGGSTPLSLYEYLATSAYRERVDWSRMHFFWGDERCVPPDHSDSNYLAAWKALLSKVPVPPGHVHRIQAELSPDLAAERYEAELTNFFSANPTRAEAQTQGFDLVFLGVGEDGHTASLFPGTDVLQEKKRWVKEVYVNRLNTWRITITPTMLNRASQVIFLAAGAGKSAALQEIWHGKYQPERFPAQLIRPVNGNILWLVDQAAASGVTASGVTAHEDTTPIARTGLPKLLITGFEPFGGSPVNPSEKILSSFANLQMERATLIPVLLPVDRQRGPETLLEAFRTHQPDAVVCLGEASGRAMISIERIAINLLDYRIPDNSGVKVIDEEVIPGGPVAYFTTLPLRKIHQAITQAGIPAELSLSAGAYLCNQVLYHLLHHLAGYPRSIPAGFIHLPALPEQVIGKSGAMPSMSLDASRQAILIAIDSVLHELSTTR